MASFIQAIMRMVSPSSRPHDEEHGTVTGSVTLDHGPSVVSNDLTLFRLMVGITTPPHLGSTARPAENIGLYARVVRSEQTSKDNYKVFSAVINACYFLQIIIAAALTALGAANADNKAITAFGAINTVIAGLLTYLKGSGLPGRLKYFGNEWKKIREYIEQRERDFSYEGCALDVYEVVETIREMYATTKRDIEMNSPESYSSVTRLPAGGGAVDPVKADEVAGKLKSMEDTVRKLKSRLEKTTHDTVDTIHDEEKRAAAELSRYGKDVSDTAHAIHDEEKRVTTDLGNYGKDITNTAHAMRDEEKRVTAELRSYGKAMLGSGLDDRPRHPREASYGGTDESRTVIMDDPRRGV